MNVKTRYLRFVSSKWPAIDVTVVVIVFQLVF